MEGLNKLFNTPESRNGNKRLAVAVIFLTKCFFHMRREEEVGEMM